MRKIVVKYTLISLKKALVTMQLLHKKKKNTLKYSS